MSTSTNPLVVLVGPTASGKSALGLFLAEQLGGEILICDSTQVYRHFDIGTAKDPPALRQRVPHHLVDLCEPDEEFTAGDYLRLGRQALEAVSARGRLPVVTAGTGLYLRALLEGLSPLPPRSPELRARLQERAEERGPEYLHRLLARVDAASARDIAPRDTPKLVRALEVYFQVRRPRSELFREGRPRLEGYAVSRLGLLPERQALYERIEARVEEMLEAGWLEEVRRLRERFPDTAKPFSFIGYRQLVAHLCGELSLKEAVKQVKHETRQYAKRQITWFRKEPGVAWLRGFGDDRVIGGAALNQILLSLNLEERK
ncbi:MAG: tRNA (adenosine(37)-N6)-dimethylallyltransferase MiaA [Acidobacteria bacterium]|nr:tRNA (adenosine(37)-N6)-dimethylallyltransferase MiaA [Acidobacteriota bacterium]